MKKPLPLFLSLGLILLAISACSVQETTSAPVDEPSPPVLESTETQALQPSPTEEPSEVSPSLPVVDAPQLTSMRFFDESHGWGMTGTNVLRTEDGGVTWLDVSPAVLLISDSEQSDIFTTPHSDGWQFQIPWTRRNPASYFAPPTVA